MISLCRLLGARVCVRVVNYISCNTFGVLKKTIQWGHYKFIIDIMPVIIRIVVLKISTLEVRGMYEGEMRSTSKTIFKRRKRDK